MNSAQRQEAAAMEIRERKRVTDLLARAERENRRSLEQLAEKRWRSSSRTEPGLSWCASSSRRPVFLSVSSRVVYSC